MKTAIAGILTLLVAYWLVVYHQSSKDAPPHVILQVAPDGRITNVINRTGEPWHTLIKNSNSLYFVK